MNLEEKRLQILNSIPKNYSPGRHFGFNVGFSLLVLLVILIVGTISLKVVPIYYLSFFVFEWAVHKYLLHKPLIKTFYDFHTSHHILYTNNQMGISDWKELSWILIPRYLYCLFAFGIILSGIAMIKWFSPEIGYTMMFSSFTFYVFYEICHLCWHLMPGIKYGKFHTIHHNPSNMRFWNFNVTIPIIDWIVRSLKK